MYLLYTKFIYICMFMKKIIKFYLKKLQFLKFYVTLKKKKGKKIIKHFVLARRFI